MTKDEMTAALGAMLEQGNQLRASELIPALKGILEQTAKPVSWEFNLIRNEPYTTWESVNMTQEIYDAIINGTIDLINIKWYFEGTVGIPIKTLSHNDAGVIDVRSGFSGSHCTKALTFDVNPDGTVSISWD